MIAAWSAIAVVVMPSFLIWSPSRFMHEDVRMFRTRNVVQLLLNSWFLIACLVAEGAEVHYATRLGDPATRFAPPLKSPDDLRAFFSDPSLRNDIEAVLRDIRWRGDVNDLYAAAESALIEELLIVPETRMAFMTTRRNGRPVVLKNVIWRGDNSAPAFKFSFVSRGRLYRCVTPKACSNFFLEDIGPEPPTVDLQLEIPDIAGRCVAMNGIVRVINNLDFQQGGLDIMLSLSEGLQFSEGERNRSIKSQSVAAHSEAVFELEMNAAAIGTHTVIATVMRGGRLLKKIENKVVVRQAALDLRVTANQMVPLGKPFDICFTASNLSGTDAGATIASLTLPGPFNVISTGLGITESDGIVVWNIPAIGPSESATSCLRVEASAVGDYDFSPVVDEHCTDVTVNSGGTKVVGISAILLEVVDLDDPVEVGSEVVYEIVAVNQGTASATNVRFDCVLPASQRFIGCDGPTDAHLVGNEIEIEPLEELPAGGQSVWRVTVEAVSQDDSRFFVRMLTDQLDRPVEETEATNLY